MKNRQSPIANRQLPEVFHHHQITPGLIILSVEDRSAVGRSTQVVEGTSSPSSERRILMSAKTEELKSVGPCARKEINPVVDNRKSTVDNN